MQPESWVTAQQAADYLGISRNKIYPRFLRGEIPARKIGRSWRTKLSWVDKAAETGTIRNTEIETL